MHLSLATLLFGMVAALVYLTATASGKPPETTMVAVLAGAVLFTLALDAWGMLRAPRLMAVQVLVVAITLSGAPGLLLHPAGEMLTGMTFLLLLGLRNYICFAGIPQSRIAATRPAERAILWWFLGVVVVVVVGALSTANRIGISLNSAARLTGEGNAWLNANTTGLYCAYGVVVCAMASFVPWWIRLSVAAPALYCIILTQSRTSFAAAIVAFGVNLVIVYARRKLLGIGVAVCGVCALFLWQNSLLSLIDSVPHFVSSLNVAQDFSGTANTRVETVQHGLETWSQAPIFGFGYGGDGSRLENGYLSLACETGGVGLSLYLCFVALMLRQARRLLKTPQNTRSYSLGRYLLCTTVFVLVHALGERTHGFQIASPVSNSWAMLCSLAFTVQCVGRPSAFRLTRLAPLDPGAVRFR